MADSFNPYAEWLGLPAHLVEPNHYQLLGLADFESDPAKIATAADRATAKVRSFRPGGHARAWSKLLDELLLAKAHLTEPERKSEYDAELREQPSQPASAPTHAPASVSKSEAGPRSQDPRFPPGMGPNQGRASSGYSLPESSAEDNRGEEKPAEESRPTSAARVEPAQPMTTVLQAAPLAAPLAQPVAPTAWPDSMRHPVAHGPQPAAQSGAQHAAPLAQPMYGAPPTGYPQMPGTYPAAQPMYGVPAYGQPAYAQPAYGQPAPYAMPTYGAPYAQPAPYAAPPGYPAPMNYGAPSFAPTPLAPPFDPASHGAGYAPSLPLDPMAPVALPPSLPGADEGKQARVMGFAGAQSAPGAIPAGSIPTGSLPKGKAVSPAATSSDQESTARMSPAPAGPAISTGPLAGPGAISRSDLATYSPPSSSEKLVLYGTISAVILLVGAIAFAIANANRGGEQVANNPEPEAPAPKALPRVEPVTVKPGTSGNKIGNTAPVQKPNQQPTVTRPMTDPVEPVRPGPMPEPMQPEPIKPDPPKPVTPEPMTPEPVKPEPVKPEPPKPEPAKPEPPKPEPPMPKPPEPMPTVMLTPVELETLSKSAKTARDALSERNFEEFEKQLSVAKQLARSPNQMAQVDRLEMLGQYVKQFDRQLKTLLTDENFDAGAELRIGKSTVVNVVERSPTTLVIRVAGVNKSYNVNSLPDGLAMALIDKRLDPGDPVRHLVKGAYLAAAKVATEETREKAKELFEQATREGADAGDLALVLTDTYEFKE